MFKKYLLLICCIVFALFFAVGQVSAEPLTSRIMGKDRYQTSIEISKLGWRQSNYAILATGENFPDSLCAGPLAKKYEAPILLTQKDSLDEVLVEELNRLEVKEVFLIGGQGVVGANIEKTLQGKGIIVTRIAGKNRYETAVKIAEKLGQQDEIVVATGRDFPDALSIAAIAASKGIPILLSDKDEAPIELKQYIKGQTINKSYIVGGPGVISDVALQGIPNSERLAGKDRYETNITILNKFSSSLNYDEMFIATGENFPDALSASALASKNTFPIILSSQTNSKQTKDFINSKIDISKKINVIGGEKVISVATLLDLLKKQFKICVDAGHGGYDSGAVSPNGLKEKDITLAVALKLGSILKSQGIEVVYTRTTDKVTWPADELADLTARCAIADKEKVDFFIAIHVNSFNATSQGIETFSFSEGDAGAQFAKAIQEELIKATGLVDRGTKTANFYVLKNTDAPAVLTELGFITNPAEEKLLASEAYQNQCANAIAKAITKVLLNNGQ